MQACESVEYLCDFVCQGHRQNIEIHGCAVYPADMVWPLAPRQFAVETLHMHSGSQHQTAGSQQIPSHSLSLVNCLWSRQPYVSRANMQGMTSQNHFQYLSHQSESWSLQDLQCKWCASVKSSNNHHLALIIYNYIILQYGNIYIYLNP